MHRTSFVYACDGFEEPLCLDEFVYSTTYSLTLLITNLKLEGLGGASISWDAMDDNQNYVKECGFTRYPSLCVETLTRLGSANQPVDIVLALVNKTISETKLTTSNFAKFSSQFEAQELAERAHYVTGYCEELMNMSLKWLEQSMLALKDSPEKNKHDIQTWLSAALTFQQACKDSTENLSLSDEYFNIVQNQISKKMDHLSQLGSNPLALVNRITSTGTGREGSVRLNEAMEP
ncbi:hypothetical protein SO802_030039 [Lithocarpus litseifolius]|uniref:Pectinesterase inhibitor domain-containing protein n=1 Tax=Lithocarpus litseifolius TaxID=425828 RepID=A0AAW2BY56_9ROSI